MRDCYRYALRWSCCVVPDLFGIECADRNPWCADDEAPSLYCSNGSNNGDNAVGTDATPNAQRAEAFEKGAAEVCNADQGAHYDVLCAMENEALDRALRLKAQHKRATNACSALMRIRKEPCLRLLESYVQKCLCERCVAKNLLFIEMLRRYERARHCNDEQSLAALDEIVSRFSRACNDTKEIVQRPPRSCAAPTSSSSSTTSVHEAVAFAQWRLPRKSAARGVVPRCAQSFATISSPKQLEQFYSETSYFMSPLF
jgi:hypothetical protein